MEICALEEQNVLKSDCEQAYDVINIDSVNSILLFDELGEETNILDMTSLSALMLLNQADPLSNNQKHQNSSDEQAVDQEEYRLSLAYERLHVMPKVLLQELAANVKILDISNNEFENLGFLAEFKQLTTLICDHNKITSLTYFPVMPQLEILWMNHCKITELYPWAFKLQQTCYNLKQLSLMGNPAAPSYLNGGSFYEYLKYRLFIISLFSSLVHLDDRRVTEDQRAEAQRMYRRPFLERIASNAPAKLPTCLRSVSDKLSEIITPASLINVSQKNCVI